MNAPQNQRERWSELLCFAPAEALIQLADEVLDAGTACEVIRAPEIGSVVVQVREPIARQRFQLADLVVTSAEVRLAGEPGWAMRTGSDRHAALAQAICEAELVRSGPWADRIEELLDRVAQERQAARTQEWERLRPTTVEFEEVL